MVPLVNGLWSKNFIRIRFVIPSDTYHVTKKCGIISISNFGSLWNYLMPGLWYNILDCRVLPMKDWYLMPGWWCQANDVILDSVYLWLPKEALTCRYRIVARCWIYVKKLVQLIIDCCAVNRTSGFHIEGFENLRLWFQKKNDRVH